MGFNSLTLTKFEGFILTKPLPGSLCSYQSGTSTSWARSRSWAPPLGCAVRTSLTPFKSSLTWFGEKGWAREVASSLSTSGCFAAARWSRARHLRNGCRSGDWKPYLNFMELAKNIKTHTTNSTTPEYFSGQSFTILFPNNPIKVLPGSNLNRISGLFDYFSSYKSSL